MAEHPKEYLFAPIDSVSDVAAVRAMLPKDGKRGAMIYNTDTDTTYMLDLIRNTIAYVRHYQEGLRCGTLVIDMRNRAFYVQYMCIIRAIIDGIVDDPATRAQVATQFKFVFVQRI